MWGNIWYWSPRPIKSRQPGAGVCHPAVGAQPRVHVGSSVNGSHHTGSAVRRLDASDQQWLSLYADRLQRYPNCYDCVGLSR